MTRTRSNTQYKLTSLGKIVLAVCLIGLFTLGLFIGKSIFANAGGSTPAPNPPDSSVGAPIDGNDNGDSKDVQQDAASGADNTQAPASTSAAVVPALGYDESKLSALDTKSSGWGFGNNVDENNRPIGSINAENAYSKYDADFIAPQTKNVYLTIDEGYENGYTSKILDVLKEKECPAVFFVTLSYVKSNPELVQRMITEGHVVGNHSSTHPSKGLPSQTIAEQAKEVTELHKYVKDNFGYDMYLFRFPAGIYSEQSLALVQELGYRSVFWSFAYRDWETDNQPDPAASLAKLNSKMHEGAIYLLHAVSATNTEIMVQFIDDTRAAGYTFAIYPQSFSE